MAHGGSTDIAGFKAVIDFLNGRVQGFNAQTGGDNVTVNWHNGKSGMIGKSYDGTYANGTAATGVEGLTTIVPISAISAWYNYSRTAGVRHNTNYPSGLSSSIAGVQSDVGVQPPRPTNSAGQVVTRQALCAPTRTLQDEQDGDEHGDINEFWRDRDHNKDANKVKASVFIVHGFQDDNVRMDHVGLWWDALKANGVKTKMWLMRTGHVDPFEQRRAVWVDTLHRWFDQELQGIDNGIDAEPRVTVEDVRRRLGELLELADPGHAEHRRLPAREDGRRGRHARRRQRRLVRLADVHQHRGHAEREQRDQHAGGLAGQPPRVPLRAADQAAAPVRHGEGAAAGVVPRRSGEPERRDRRLRRGHADLARR